jgi:hypothetical protein
MSERLKVRGRLRVSGFAKMLALRLRRALSGNVKALFLARTAPDRVAAPARKIK